MKRLISIILLTAALHTQGQVLNKFVWDAAPLTKAAIGPDAISVSSLATSGAIAAPLNFGINPGSTRTNIDLVLPGATFNVPSIEIDVFFRYEETVASFFKRGSLFDFGMSGSKLSVKYSYKSSATGSNVTVNSPNTFTLPNDHAFHQYTFRYDSVSGTGTVLVDKVVVYTLSGVANSGLNWTGAGNAIVGEQMDGNGYNNVILSQLTISTFANATLPSEITKFDATLKNGLVHLDWTAVHEANVNNYEVERSIGNSGFVSINTTHPKNSYNTSTNYQLTDSTRFSQTAYYRLKTIDKNGAFKYSNVVKVTPVLANNKVVCFPSAATSFTNLSFTNAEAGNYTVMIATFGGQIVKSSTVSLANGVQQLKIDLSGNIPSGNLIVTILNNSKQFHQSFKIVKV